MRMQAQRAITEEEDESFSVGDRFLVGYILDNAEITLTDRVMLLAAAQNQMTIQQQSFWHFVGWFHSFKAPFQWGRGCWITHFYRRFVLIKKEGKENQEPALGLTETRSGQHIVHMWPTLVMCQVATKRTLPVWGHPPMRWSRKNWFQRT